MNQGIVYLKNGKPARRVDVLNKMVADLRARGLNIALDAEQPFLPKRQGADAPISAKEALAEIKKMIVRMSPEDVDQVEQELVRALGGDGLEQWLNAGTADDVDQHNVMRDDNRRYSEGAALPIAGDEFAFDSRPDLARRFPGAGRIRQAF